MIAYLSFLVISNLVLCTKLITCIYCNSNLSSEQGYDSTKFQKVDVESNVQLTPTSVIKENKRSCLVTSTKQQGRRYKRLI